ncbi:MAG: metallophosphoesterase [Actinobacteria bacterium]|nr:metallophosphoesterase [Actinomycetota bacterium]
MRLYFCSDLHASRKCWKKFLASWKFYEADHIIVGGDITGKFIVPIVERAGGVKSTTFLGVERRAETSEEVATLKQRIDDAGQYAFETTPEEQAWYGEDQRRIDGLFRRLVLERVEEWVAETDEKLAGTGVRVFVSGANDDLLEVDDVLAKSELIEDPNGRVIELEGGFELLGMGWGNPTPWNCPRDIPEEELAERIDMAAEAVRDPARTIFSLHVPPLGSGLDLAPKLDDYLRPRLNAGGFEMVPVGSTATRDAIEKYRPLIGLHGHIHESKGVKKLAGVPIANPGSEYAEGILNGVLVDIGETGVSNIQLVSG